MSKSIASPPQLLASTATGQGLTALTASHVPPLFDEGALVGTVAKLMVYPIKSCGGVALAEAVVLDTGIDLDRAWMVVDANGRFISQREYPRMALVRPQLKQFEMVLRAPGMLGLHVQIDAVEKPCRVQVWDDTASAYDMGDVAAQWFSMFLTGGTSALRLVRFDPEYRRLSNKDWTKGVDAPNQFSDGFPMLVCSQNAVNELNIRLQAAGQVPVGLERFRPNIVIAGWDAHAEDGMGDIRVGPLSLRLVKPCTRCSIPSVDPETGLVDLRLSQVLSNYRADARMGGAVTFGMNAVVLNSPDSCSEVLIRLGDTVFGKPEFD